MNVSFSNYIEGFGNIRNMIIDNIFRLIQRGAFFTPPPALNKVMENDCQLSLSFLHAEWAAPGLNLISARGQRKPKRVNLDDLRVL